MPAKPPPPEADKAKPKNKPVAVRLPLAVIANIDELRPMFPGASGEPTTRSDVLRRMIADGFLVLEPSVIRTIDELRGFSSRASTLANILAIGIKSLAAKKRSST